MSSNFPRYFLFPQGMAEVIGKNILEMIPAIRG